MELEQKNKPSWLDKPITSFLPPLNLETLIIAAILILAVVTRFSGLGLRVMSHDEVNHVVPAFDLFQGRDYRHDPVTHGPFQFHLLAMSYFILGDNDFSARVPAAIFSVATVAAALFCFRRYLGRTGTILAGIFFLVSPYMLFYGRYTRNEAFVGLFGVLMLYAVLRYLEKKDKFSIFLLTGVTALHYTTKETAYFYSAQMLLFLTFFFLWEILRKNWGSPEAKKRFTLYLIIFAVLVAVVLAFAVWDASISVEAAQPVVPEGGGEAVSPMEGVEAPMTVQKIFMAIGAGLSLITVVMLIVTLVTGYGWQSIRSHASFDLLIISGTLILPLLAAFLVKFAGWDPLDYTSAGMLRTSIFVVICFAAAVGVGLWWKPKLWLLNAALFYGIFIFFYTTFFNNGQGFFTGLVGSLGYWLSQQDVERGSQPYYYYALVQVPMYEYLAALGTLVALYFGTRFRKMLTIPGIAPAKQADMPEDADDQQVKLPIVPLLVFWSITALFAYTYAGEKMPWLTVHITLPMLLAAGWGLGFLADRLDWKKIFNNRNIIALVLVFLFIFSIGGVLGSLFGTTPPFQGNTLDQLNATSTFLLSFVTAAVSGGFAIWLLKDWELNHIFSMTLLSVFVILTALTARSAYLSSFVNYDNAKEYLVYAHAARGPKEILKQVEEISMRTTGGKDILVAYDNDSLYPYWWYLRNYPNHRWYTDTPTRDLRDYPIIISGDSTFSKIEPIVRENYVMYEYMRLWWPNQDYFNLTWERVWNAVKTPEIRAGIFDIWLNRDYTQYATATDNHSLTLETWSPSEKIRMYIRKDIIAEMWNYGTAPVLPELSDVDPYEDKFVQLEPDFFFGWEGSDDGLFSAPRGLAFAPDGSLYVADSQNHRIQKFSAEGVYQTSWGGFAASDTEIAPAGLFNEPWGMAVGPDGSVYVSDTWNHRIQKFSANGEFELTWGYFGQGDEPTSFYGPRGVAVDADGRVYVADTGNKRIVVFNENGVYLTQFGTHGYDTGQFDEPVGVALDVEGNVYVTDTWNQRIQVFTPDLDRSNFFPLSSWDVAGWYGQSLDNKPFIAVDPLGYVFVTDPESYRVLQFDLMGEFIRGWGDYSPDVTGFGLPSGIAVDPDGRVWISDASNNRILRFDLAWTALE